MKEILIMYHYFSYLTCISVDKKRSEQQKEKQAWHHVEGPRSEMFRLDFTCQNKPPIIKKQCTKALDVNRYDIKVLQLTQFIFHRRPLRIQTVLKVSAYLRWHKTWFYCYYYCYYYYYYYY